MIAYFPSLIIEKIKDLWAPSWCCASFTQPPLFILFWPVWKTDLLSNSSSLFILQNNLCSLQHSLPALFWGKNHLTQSQVLSRKQLRRVSFFLWPNLRARAASIWRHKKRQRSLSCSAVQPPCTDSLLHGCCGTAVILDQSHVENAFKGFYIMPFSSSCYQASITVSYDVTCNLWLCMWPLPWQASTTSLERWFHKTHACFFLFWRVFLGRKILPITVLNRKLNGNPKRKQET